MVEHSILHVELQDDPAHDLPPPKSYSDGELPGSVRVAFASNRGERLDGHFGSCARFLVYQVSEEEIRLIDVRTADDAQSADDKNTYRSDLIRDCDLLFVIAIGGPAAAKVVKAGLLPIRQPEETGARKVLIKLQQRLSENPPRWLSKARGKQGKRSNSFSDQYKPPALENEP
jgi:nitrogen fixation protein NifX